MTWVAAAGAAVAVVGGVAQADAAKKAANKQAGAAGAASAEQQRQYDLARQDQAPYRTVGMGALNQLASLYGIAQYQPPPSFEEWGRQNPQAFVLPAAQGQKHGGLLGHLKNAIDPTQAFKDTGLISSGGGGAGMTGEDQARQQYQQYLQDYQSPSGGGGSFAQPVDPNTGMQQGFDPNQGTSPGQPNYNAFFNSPDYQFTLGQGQQALERSAAARGGLFSGNTGAALQQYGQGLASTQIGNYTNRLASLAGLGQTSVQNTGQIGFNTGQGVANNLIDAGNARASGIVGQGNAFGDALGTIGGAAQDYFGSAQRRRSYTPNYIGNGLQPIGFNQGLVTMPNVRY